MMNFYFVAVRLKECYKYRFRPNIYALLPIASKGQGDLLEMKLRFHYF
jgi:hypothetical protein